VPPATHDTVAPAVHVFAASGRAKRTVRLRYRVGDNSGKTAERILVYRKTKVLKTFARPLRTTDNAVAYWVGYAFRTRGAYRFCVRATDAAGNKSPLRCAAVRVR
jgi:hypothetical protein